MAVGRYGKLGQLRFLCEEDSKFYLVAHHFNQPHHFLKDLTIMIIEKIHGEEANFCKLKESYILDRDHQNTIAQWIEPLFLG